MDGETWAVEGVIRTPGFPYEYMDYQSCDQQIHALPNTTIRVVVDMMDVEYHSSCRWDWLQVGEYFPILTPISHG